MLPFFLGQKIQSFSVSDLEQPTGKFGFLLEGFDFFISLEECVLAYVLCIILVSDHSPYEHTQRFLIDLDQPFVLAVIPGFYRLDELPFILSVHFYLRSSQKRAGAFLFPAL